MRARNKLNVKQIGGLTKAGIYSDGGGLYLRVRPTGSKSWLYIYSMGAKRREMGLGSDLDVTLAKARDKAAAARSLVLEGLDPQIERARVQLVALPAVTFGTFAMQWLDGVEGGFKNAKHRQQWRNTLTTYAQPLFTLPVTDVTTEAVLNVLKPIWLTKAETASRVRGRIERVLDAAKVSGLREGENPARGRGHLDLLLPKRPKGDGGHHAALPFRDIPTFIPSLRQRSGTAARALEFTILTAARSGETRGMIWAEINLPERVWTVPAERMKAGATHQVPLSDAAMNILVNVRKPDAASDDIVFAAPRGGKMSDMTMAAVLKRMGRPDITVHGFRSTFRDWAGEMTQFGREEIEMSLAHTIVSATERAYRRDRALDKRRIIMTAWAAYCAVSGVSGDLGPDRTASNEDMNSGLATSAA